MARPKDPEKKQLILDCSLELVAVRGFHAVSVKDIATRAQISLGSVYTYFESKETLVNELYRTWKNRLMEAIGTPAWRSGWVMEREGENGSFSPSSGLFGVTKSRLTDARKAHKLLCHRLGGFIRTYPRAFLFLETHLHAEYLDADSLAMEQQVTEAALGFYRSHLGIDTARARPESVQILLSASFGAFVQLFKAHQAGLIGLDDDEIEELEAHLWSMIEGFRRAQEAQLSQQETSRQGPNCVMSAPGNF